MNHHNHKFRFFFFFFFAFLSYVIFFVSAFFFNAIFYAVWSFILLFVFLYFLSIDLYARKRIWVWLNFLWLTLIEFLIMLWHTRHVFLWIILFNLSILILVLFLLYHLKIRSSFSAFAYFTEWWYIIAALLTVFFSVLLLGKYSEIPFTCDDIEQFPENLVEGELNKMSDINDTVNGKWNHRFCSE